MHPALAHLRFANNDLNEAVLLNEHVSPYFKLLPQPPKKYMHYCICS